MVFILRALPALSCNNAQLLRKAAENIKFWKRWRNTINVDKSIEHGHLIPNIKIDEVGISTIIGKRRYQEDRLSVKVLQNGMLYLGLFDGHGGSLAAEYAMKIMPAVLQNVLDDSSTKSVVQALDIAFNDVNTKLLEYVQKRNETERYSGTTATVCLINDNLHLHTASVGDSRALLCRSGEALGLTNDHSPDREDERLRIEGEGGLIVSNSLGEPLVNGRLAMTRSIGDFDLKPYGVTSKPEYSYKKLKHSKDSCLVLITDGVTFSMTNQEVADIISSTESPQLAADEVTAVSIQLGSQDNSSALVLPLGSWGQFHDRPNRPDIKLQVGRFLAPRD